MTKKSASFQITKVAAMTMVSTKVKEILHGTIPRARTLRSTVAVHGTTQQAQIGRNRVIWITLKRIPYRL